MRKNNRINRNTRITSTSDVTIDDIIGVMADELPNEPCRSKIEKIVKETVRPCAIGGVPTVVAGVTVSGISPEGVRFGASMSKTACCGSSSSDKCTSGVGTGIGSGVGIGVGIVTPADGDILMKNGSCTSDTDVARNSKWYNLVLQNGEVCTPYTVRRFLPVQYLELMMHNDGNIDAAIARRYNLRDCFRLLDTEIEKLIFISKHYRSSYAERSKFLTIDNCREIFTQYLDGLKMNINDRGRCSFSKRTGEYWRKIQGYGRVVLWTEKKTNRDGASGYHIESTETAPTDWLSELNGNIENALRRISSITTYDKALSFLRNTLPQISMGTFTDSDGLQRYWLPKAWKEAFKKQGAYYTLKSLIINCFVRYSTEEGDWRHRSTKSCVNARDGLNKLAALSDPGVPAYVVHAILKKSIEESKLDVSKLLKHIHSISDARR